MKTMTVTEAHALAEEAADELIKSLLELNKEYKREYELLEEEELTISGYNAETTRQRFIEEMLKSFSKLIVITPDDSMGK